MGFIFKKEKFGKFGEKFFKFSNSEKLHFVGFSEGVFYRPKLSDKTGLVLVGLMGGPYS
jgi:hypothetical protein